MTPTAQSDYRIFRAIEKVGDEEKTADFKVLETWDNASSLLS